jgi:hypothetical protein
MKKFVANNVDHRVILIGMGSIAEGVAFAKKQRLDLNKLPLFVDNGENRPVYNAFGLQRPDSLLELYRTTVDLNTFVSSFRALGSGQVPSYGDGGDLLQLGGTFVVGPDDSISMWHVDDKTGGHPSAADLQTALVPPPQA